MSFAKPGPVFWDKTCKIFSLEIYIDSRPEDSRWNTEASFLSFLNFLNILDATYMQQ